MRNLTRRVDTVSKLHLVCKADSEIEVCFDSSTQSFITKYQNTKQAFGVYKISQDSWGLMVEKEPLWYKIEGKSCPVQLQFVPFIKSWVIGCGELHILVPDENTPGKLIFLPQTKKNNNISPVLLDLFLLV